MGLAIGATVMTLIISPWRKQSGGHINLAGHLNRPNSLVIAEELGIKLENVTPQDLGRAKRIVVDKDNTTVIDGAGKKSKIEGRIKQIRAHTGG
jgi:hypothetical protein